ncbi:MAG: NAD(P)-dependent oxidoreductase, partial [Ferruginibacter sp.]
KDCNMKMGLIREGKTPADNRVALTPAQCKWIKLNVPDLEMMVQSSPSRCFPDHEYKMAGVPVLENIDTCDVLLGIKEVPQHMLIPGKTYMFFSHTKKLQPYNQPLLRTIIEKKITLIDYECLEHDDGTRIIGFGFFAGVVGAHNGMMAYGRRSGAYQLGRVGESKNFQQLIHTYFGLKLPNVKIAVTGSGRVAHGVLEIMNLMGIHEVEPEEYLERNFSYPAYVHLKGADLYTHKETGKYEREKFHTTPGEFNSTFASYVSSTDIIMNGVYWEPGIPRLFEAEDMLRPDFQIQTIADITDDKYGSVPCNLGDSTIENPIYGVNKMNMEKTAPFIPGSIDVMAVGNLPNELPRDASRYFGEQLIKFILPDLLKGGSDMLKNATIIEAGKLTQGYAYMKDYASAEAL